MEKKWLHGCASGNDGEQHMGLREFTAECAGPVFAVIMDTPQKTPAQEMSNKTVTA